MAQVSELGLGLPPALEAGQPSARQLERSIFTIENMSCGGCMRAVERAALDIEGVSSARANLSAKRVTVSFDPTLIDDETIIGSLDRAGFRAGLLTDSALPDHSDRDLLRRVAVAGFAAANIMLLSVSVWAGAVSDMDAETATLFHWLSALIALPTVAYAGQPFYGSAAEALRGRRLNMDVPISLAILLAAGMSLYQTIQGGAQIYFDAAVTLLFFLLIGRYLDRRMRLRARGAAQNLMGLRALRATIVAEDGAHRRVAAEEVAAGTRVFVAPGEAIPVDGRILSGDSDVDESLISGETRPRAVSGGARVFAGTVNLLGALEIDATAASESTLLADLARLMEAAEQGKGRYVRLADRAAQIYAPVVHILGALTFAGWMLAGAGWDAALTTAIAVLIITCPCALALAVPSVQVTAAARLFARGIILKSGDGLERLADIDHVVFDKTGTLTVGRPKLVNGSAIDDDTLGRAAALAATSRHPWSRAIVDAAAGRGLRIRPAGDVTEHPGAGLSRSPDGIEERLGSAAWCDAGDEAGAEMSLYYRAGPSAPVGFVFSDPVRTDARDTVAALEGSGLGSEILSGDNSDAVARAATETGIARHAAGQRPDAKIARLDTLRAAGHRVLMVGDGLNDAPSLATAHASMSPSTAADISQQAADAVFQGDRLAPVLEALAVARAAKRLSLQNFALAAAYNAICIPLAAAGFVTPLIAAIAMSSSSIIVTANALRLRNARLELAP